MSPGGDWRHRAACRDVDPELFFPVGSAGPAQVQTARAKAVCARCPVVAECLGFAVRALAEGVAGGLTAAERGRLRQRADRGHCAQRGSRGRAVTAQRLRAAGWRAGTIAAHLGVNERTVYRLMKRVS